MKNSILGLSELEIAEFLDIFILMRFFKFPAQLGWVWKKFFGLETKTPTNHCALCCFKTLMWFRIRDLHYLLKCTLCYSFRINSNIELNNWRSFDTDASPRRGNKNENWTWSCDRQGTPTYVKRPIKLAILSCGYTWSSSLYNSSTISQPFLVWPLHADEITSYL